VSQTTSRKVVMQLDLALCLAIAVAAFVATLLGVELILRLPLVAALALFVPGYGLLSALMVGSGLSALERTMVAISTSVALTIVCGLLMSVFGIPIERESWVYALTTISVFTLVVAWVRRWQSGVEGPRPALTRTPVRQTAIVVIAALILVNIVAASRIIASDQFGAPPSALWMVEGSNPYIADLGFRSDGTGGAYRLVLSANGETIQEFDVTLGPSQTWERQLVLGPEQRSAPLVARLFEGDSAVESRFVVLQALPTSAPSGSAPSPSAAPTRARPSNGA
jgi:Protein of unknown function (DUF1616)